MSGEFHFPKRRKTVKKTFYYGVEVKVLATRSVAGGTVAEVVVIGSNPWTVSGFTVNVENLTVAK